MTAGLNQGAHSSPLAIWAEAELEGAGLFGADADYDGEAGRAALELVKVFAAQGHSGGSARLVAQVFGELARWRPLSPLTSDPDEWMQISEAEPCWQSRRRPDAFSRDGGQSFYLLDDPWPRWRRWLGLPRATRRSAPAKVTARG